METTLHYIMKKHLLFVLYTIKNLLNILSFSLKQPAFFLLLMKHTNCKWSYFTEIWIVNLKLASDSISYIQKSSKNFNTLVWRFRFCLCILQEAGGHYKQLPYHHVLIRSKRRKNIISILLITSCVFL